MIRFSTAAIASLLASSFAMAQPASDKSAGDQSASDKAVVRLDPASGADKGPTILAIDSVDAGVGDRVLLVQDGKAAIQALGRGVAAVDAAIVGVVDEVDIGA